MSYKDIHAHPVLGEQIIWKLLKNPISLLDPLQINQWLVANNAPDELKFKDNNDVIRLNNWISVLNSFEKTFFYYSVAGAQTRVRFQKKRMGPILPIGNAVALITIGGGMIVGGAIGGLGVGAVGGVALTSELIESAHGRPIGTGLAVASGPLLTVGGAAITGALGTLAGSAVATVCVLGAAEQLTYGVIKSVILWPTTPFELARSNALVVMTEILREFSKLIDQTGNFNHNYSKVLTQPNLMGGALYSFYLDVQRECEAKAKAQTEEKTKSQTEEKAKAQTEEKTKAQTEESSVSSVSVFLSSFKELINNWSFLPSELVYRKIKHIKSLMLLNLGCPDRTYEKISSNAGPSYVSDWINSWEKKFAELKKSTDESTMGRIRQSVSTTTSNVFN